ncbi:hypothetical protein SAMN04487948_107102 [Halogranum amylolyticum]|uniref:DUF7344 domain-containing protein n=1 Tax=Halogranum amylolyticum TaxID=660520 RepID=A0A1H8TK80_9EURY|nr:hypothetical protein [Halogranum amylolyticum]SEO90983.1 hypothetical protein SAMN04487948_107102 [Halogranum amylolyticum]
MQRQTTRPDTGTDRTEQTRGEPTLSKDELFEILKNRRRRDVLTNLDANGGSAILGEMAEYIAAKENDIEVSTLSSSQRKRVYIGLYQCHLPKMANYGIVDFDKGRGTIALRPTATLFGPYLDAESVVLDDNVGSIVGRRTSAAAAVALLVAAGLAGVPVLSALPAAGWAVVSTVALLACALEDQLT